MLGTILATGLAGIGFGLLRLGSGCILAPMGLHWATNSTGSIAAWLLSKRKKAQSAATDSETAERPEAPPIRDVELRCRELGSGGELRAGRGLRA